ncbi:MAG: septal ring lytic transglycosylase RlpA family protein [Panacagrimonas sp.]
MKLRTTAAALVPVVLMLTACATTPPSRPSKPAPRQVRIPPPEVSVVPRRIVMPPAVASKAQAPRATAEETAGETLDEVEEIVERDGPPDPRDIPPDLANIPDPIPVHEPKSAGGNPLKYEVFGRTYKVMSSARAFRETGLASWYGTKFHGRKTSNGEVYDMFELTAAHKHLPLPTWARVTNLGNGKSVIVRINDRGPFHSARIIDLSYAAAVRLDTLNKIALVEIEAITPGRKLPPPPKLHTADADKNARLLQVAAYTDPINAVAMREELTDQGFKPVQVRAGKLDNGDTVHRVLVGPFEQAKRMDQVHGQLRAIGYQVVAVADIASVPTKVGAPASRTARR